MPSFSGKKNQKDRIRTERGVSLYMTLLCCCIVYSCCFSAAGRKSEVLCYIYMCYMNALCSYKLSSGSSKQN